MVISFGFQRILDFAEDQQKAKVLLVSIRKKKYKSQKTTSKKIFNAITKDNTKQCAQNERAVNLPRTYKSFKYKFQYIQKFEEF